MSILIKGMEMPQGNSTISVLIYADGTVYTGHVNDSRYSAASVPTPHGRLIDATFEENHYGSMLLNPTPDVTEQDKHKARIIIEALRMAGTVIEAEGSEE